MLRLIRAACLSGGCVLATVLWSAAALAAQPPPRKVAPDSGPGPKTHLLGDWGGLRKRLEHDGIALNLTYIGQLASDISGGKAQGTAYAGQIEAKLTLDWAKLAGIHGLATHFALLNRAGRSASAEYVGDKLFHAQNI